MKPKKPDPAKNYDYTGTERVARQRQALIDAGGARIDAHLDAADLARLDALIATGAVSSRRAAIKYAVQLLPAPKKKKDLTP